MAEFLVEMFHRPRVLHSAMNQLFFAITLHLVCDDRSRDHGSNGNERHKQDEGEQNVSALGAAVGDGFSGARDHEDL